MQLPQLENFDIATVESSQTLLKTKIFLNQDLMMKLVSTYRWSIIKYVSGSGLNCLWYEEWSRSPKFIGMHMCAIKDEYKWSSLKRLLMGETLNVSFSIITPNWINLDVNNELH